MTMTDEVLRQPEAILPVLAIVIAPLPEVAALHTMTTMLEMVAIPDVLRHASMDRHREGTMTHTLAAVLHHLHVVTMILTPETILMQDLEVHPLPVAMAAMAVAVVAVTGAITMRGHIRYELFTLQLPYN